MCKMVRFLTCIAFCLAVSPSTELGAGNHSNLDVGRAKLMPNQMVIPNAGQWDENILASIRAAGINLWLTQTGIVLDAGELRGDPTTEGAFDYKASQATQGGRDVVQLGLGDLNLSKNTISYGTVIGGCNFILGSDPTRWVANVPMVDHIYCENVYLGIDLLLKLDSGLPSLSFVAEPGADQSMIQFSTTGTGPGLTPKADGFGVAGQYGSFSVRSTGVQFERSTAGETVVANFAPATNLKSSTSASTITATISYSSFLGGTQYDVINGMAIADDGSVVVVGNTESANFPTQGAFDPSYNGGSFGDVFITKLSGNGSSLVYSTFVGGAGADISSGIVLDSDGGPIITGITGSLGTFPLLGGYDSTYAGAGDGFVLKLSSTGAVLEYSTYIGGINEDYPRAIAVDDAGSVYLAGHTRSLNFPTVGLLDTDFNGGGYDAFVCKLTTAGSVLAYSGYVGGSSDDQAFGIDVDATGRAHIRGWTGSGNFPAVNAFDNSYNGGDRDAFLARVSASGDALEYSTFFGGVGSDYGVGLDLDDAGYVYLGGVTRSSDFPLANAFDSTLGGSQDLYVAKFDSSGQSLVFSTFLGGEAEDFNGLATVDFCGQVFVTGYTYSEDYPMVLPDDSTFGGGADLALSGFTPDGADLIYSSFVGGTGFEFANAISVHFGSVYLAGVTNSGDFPTAGAYDSTLTGDYDGFITVTSDVGVNECGCVCQCHADPVCDGIQNDILDVVRAITVAFRGGAPVIDPSPTCPFESTDVNCTGATDVIDVVKIISVAFRGVSPSVEFCDPCQP